MSDLSNHQGDTFEPTRRWSPATVVIDVILSVAVLLLIVGLAFVSWRAVGKKREAFAAAKVGYLGAQQSAVEGTTVIASMDRTLGTEGRFA